LIAKERCSPRLARMMTWLGGKLPYAEAREVLADVGGIHISTSSVWRRMQVWGAQIATELAAEQARQRAAARAWSTPGGRPVARGPMGVAIDGAMMHVRGEGWKEFKVACVFDVELEERVDPGTGDRGQYGHAIQSSYVVHLGGPEELGWQAWGEAQRRGWHAARDSIVIGDGARWIWNLRDEHFPASLTLVDWYHAVEHLGAAKLLLYPEAGAAASRWYNRNEQHLYEGQAKQVVHSLRTAAAHQGADSPQAEALQKAAQYFANNQHRMAYHDLRDAGWPIGSGMVESGAKQFKARVTGPGMRWSRSGAEAILPVRAAVLSGKERFHELWTHACASNSPPT